MKSTRNKVNWIKHLFLKLKVNNVLEEWGKMNVREKKWIVYFFVILT